MKRYLVLTTLFTFSMQAKETFLNHTSKKLIAESTYASCKPDNAWIPIAQFYYPKKSKVLVEYAPGKASTEPSNPKCCLISVKIVINGVTSESVQMNNKGQTIPGTQTKSLTCSSGCKILYFRSFIECKKIDRTFNIYDDSTKPNGIRVEVKEVTNK